MLVEVLADIFEYLGGLMIAITALLVHHTVMLERRIDAAVVKEITRERILAILGIIFMTVGFILHALIRFNII